MALPPGSATSWLWQRQQLPWWLVLGGGFRVLFLDVHLKFFLQSSQQFWELSKLLTNKSLSAWVSGCCYLQLRTPTTASSSNVYYQAHSLWLNLFSHEPTASWAKISYHYDQTMFDKQINQCMNEFQASMTHSRKKTLKHPEDEIRQGFDKLFNVKDQRVNIVGFRTYSFCLSDSTRPFTTQCESSHRHNVNKWVWLCSDKTWFTNTPDWLDFAHGPQFANPLPPEAKNTTINHQRDSNLWEVGRSQQALDIYGPFAAEWATDLIHWVPLFTQASFPLWLPLSLRM